MSDGDTNGIRRRNALKSIGLGALGATTFSRLGSAEGETEVVVARGGRNDEPLSTERVPTKWDRHTDAMEQVRESVSRSVRNYNFVNGCRLVRSSQKVGNMSYSKVEITVDPDTSDGEIRSLPTSLEEAGVTIPDAVQVTDIGIKKEPWKLNLGNCTDNLYEDTPFPAGYYTKVEDGSILAHSTAGYRVFDNNAGEERMLTANHVLTPGDCELGNGVDIQSYYSTVIGTGTSKGNYGTDWILVDPDLDLGDEIWDGDYRWTFDGWVTKKGCKSIRDNEYLVENYGSFTGYTTGTLDAIYDSYGNGCVNLFEQAVKCSTRMGDGDSGGPVWWDGNEGRFIIMHNSGFDATHSKSCKPLGDGNYGDYSTAFPFFRIKSNNSELTVGETSYSG